MHTGAERKEAAKLPAPGAASREKFFPTRLHTGAERKEAARAARTRRGE